MKITTKCSMMVSRDLLFGMFICQFVGTGPSSWDQTYEPCSKCLTSWHQIRKCLRHCLRFTYARAGFAYAHIFSYAELTLAYAHHSFAYATPLQGAPCLTWTQEFRTWLICHMNVVIKKPVSISRLKTTHNKTNHHSLSHYIQPEVSKFHVVSRVTYVWLFLWANMG